MLLILDVPLKYPIRYLEQSGLCVASLLKGGGVDLIKLNVTNILLHFGQCL